MIQKSHHQAPPPPPTQYYPSIDPRQIKLRKALIELAPPIITTKAWAIVHGRTGQLLFGKCEQERREFASLTKIMTFHVVQLYAKRNNNLDLRAVQVPISKNAARINGTSARTRAGDIFPCTDLLYGMMLPSGNDAALALAEFFGRLLISETQLKAKPPRHQLDSDKSTTSSQDDDDDGCDQDFKLQLYVERFILEMNRTAANIGLNTTTFMNPHGLSNHLQKSTAAEVGRMAAVAMRDPLFRKVCSTLFYQCRPLNDQKYTYRWTNTHKMLDIMGYNGIKTGITPAAGPCLATSYQVKDTHLIIILLDSKTMDHRWSQTAKLTNWCVSRLRRAVNIYGGSEGSVGETCEHMITKLKNIQTHF